MALQSLLVSRDPDVVRVFRRALEEVAVAMELSPRAEMAVERLARQKFDAVIIDCDGVAMAGQVLEALQTTSSNRRALSLAIIDGITSMREAFDMGAHFVLEKPLSLERANRCLRAAVGFMMAEQKRYFRYPVQAKVMLSSASASNALCTAINISEGGMAVSLAEPIAIGGPVEVQFELPGISQKLAASGELTWLDANTMTAGIRFVHVPEESRRLLNQWLTNKQAEMENSEPYPATTGKNKPSAAAIRR